MKFYFRVDSSLQIGSGHVVRCLTLAAELKKRGANCKFICRNHKNNLIKKIKEEGFEVVTLALNYKKKIKKNTKSSSLKYVTWIGASWKEDAKQTINILKSEKVDWLVVDHYGIDYKWEQKLRSYIKKIMVIDDLANRSHDCDLLLDQNLIADYKNRYKNILPKSCTTLVGPEFALLQDDYKDLHLSAPPRKGPAKRILVYFGATDEEKLTEKTLMAFLQLNRKDIILDIVLSSQSSQIKNIKNLAKKFKNINVHSELKSLANLILKADLAVGACGSTSWERCCLGLPSIVVTIADNQKPIAKALHKKGVVRWLGHWNKLTKDSIYNQLIASIDHNLQAWSNKCRLVTNGCGTKKVASILNLNEKTNLFTRFANIEDKELLFNFVIDPLVRRNSFNSKLISKRKHLQWFNSCLKKIKTCKILIVETSDKLPIGQVRIDKKINSWHIDYSLTNYAREKKIGFKLLKLALKKFNQIGIHNFIAKVKKKNKPSCVIFEKLGFLKKRLKEKKFNTFHLKEYNIR